MELNLLQEQDVAAFQQLRLRALHDHPEAFGTSFEEEQAQPPEQVAVQLRASPTGSFTLGAWVDANLVGLIQLLRYQRVKTRHKAMLSGMYVVPEARGQGLGTALLRAALERASGLAALEDVTLAVTVGNAAARKLYLRVGFVPYGIEPRYIKVGAQYFDIEWMILHLKESQG